MRIMDDCEFVRICELGLGVEPGSQVAGQGSKCLKFRLRRLPTAKCGANAANSDRLRIGANCEMTAQAQMPTHFKRLKIVKKLVGRTVDTKSGHEERFLTLSNVHILLCDYLVATCD